jgi:hypothetical protein
VTRPALSLIESIAELRIHLQGEPRKLARLQALQRWQVRRLEQTYADYFARPRYRDAISFFTHDLYGPHDYAQRDRDLKTVLAPWQRILPARALHAVTTALELESLTIELDLSLLDALAEREVDTKSYALAYRGAGRQAERRRQIELIVACGQALDALAAHPWVHRALRLAKTPARLAGVLVLHEFLERGFDAFAKMGSATELLNAIDQRETAIMENLMRERPDPFRVTGPGDNVAASA